MEVAQNVLKVVIGEAENNVYFVTGQRGAFYDSGYGTDETHEAIIGLWEGAGKPEIAAIVVSHWHGDHSGGAGRLSKATGAPVYSGPRDKAGIENRNKGVKVDHTPSDNETLDLGGATLRFLYAPGHTNGSLSALYVEGGFLMTGDTTRTATPFSMDPTHGAMEDQRRTIRKLQRLDLNRIGPGHGPEIDDPVKYLVDLAESIRNREW